MNLIVIYFFFSPCSLASKGTNWKIEQVTQWLICKFLTFKVIYIYYQWNFRFQKKIAKHLNKIRRTKYICRCIGQSCHPKTHIKHFKWLTYILCRTLVSLLFLKIYLSFLAFFCSFPDHSSYCLNIMKLQISSKWVIFGKYFISLINEWTNCL